jgi:DNA processing protein
MFGQDLAQAGLTVVSGLARGVDTAAHEGSLAVAGHAVAVLGTGLDVPYPRENEPLMRRIAAEGGAVTSEFPPGTPPAPRNFPQRNRVIAGLSWGVLVVEATERSGALITARFATETDREVFAVPHNITSRTGIGPNTLIQKGAKLTQRAQDILEEVPLSLRCNLKPVLDTAENPAILTLSDAGKRLFGALQPDSGRSLDALCTDTGLSTSGALAALFDLQMAGLCVELPGARYALKRPPKEP